MAENKFAQIAKQLVNVIGEDNIASVTHCATRLRFIVKDRNKIKDDDVEKVEHVKGVFFTGGQYQVILGTGIVNKVYNELVQSDSKITEKNEEENGVKTKKGLKWAIRLLADVFIPIIPILGATGLFLGLKGVFFNQTVLDLFGLSVKDIPVYVTTLVSVLTETAFAFLPALICWSAFKTFGGMPVIGFVLGLMLVSPSLPNAYQVANINSGVHPILAFGWIPIVGYQGSIMTSLVAGILGAKLEKKLRAVMPHALDLIFTPFLVLLIMLLTALLVFGPVLHLAEVNLVKLISQLVNLPFGIGGFIIGFTYPLAVMTGMHHMYIMIETTLLASTGFNPLITLCAMYAFANAGTCLGITTRAKKSTVKVTGISATITQLLGVSEPALFGVVMRYSFKPLYIMLACSAVGGGLLSLVHVKANSYGLGGVLSTLMYIYNGNQLFFYALISALVFASSYIITFLFAVPKEVLAAEE